MCPGPAVCAPGILEHIHSGLYLDLKHSFFYNHMTPGRLSEGLTAMEKLSWGPATVRTT